MRKYLEDAYNNSIYIFNNGLEYEFYKSFNKRPKKFVMALDDEHLEFAIQNKRKFMNKIELNELISWIERDNKPWGYAVMPNLVEQARILKANEKLRGIENTDNIDTTEIQDYRKLDFCKQNISSTEEALNGTVPIPCSDEVLYENRQVTEEGINDHSIEDDDLIERPSSILVSIKESLIEVRLMREGILPKKNWKETRIEINILKDEDDDPKVKK